MPNYVGGYGPFTANIMLVGEAPGEYDPLEWDVRAGTTIA